MENIEQILLKLQEGDQAGQAPAVPAQDQSSQMDPATAEAKVKEALQKSKDITDWAGEYLTALTVYCQSKLGNSKKGQAAIKAISDVKQEEQNGGNDKGQQGQENQSNGDTPKADATALSGESTGLQRALQAVVNYLPSASEDPNASLDNAISFLMAYRGKLKAKTPAQG